MSNSTRKLLRFEIAKMLIAVLANKFIVSFVIIFGTLSFPIFAGWSPHDTRSRLTVVIPMHAAARPIILAADRISVGGFVIRRSQSPGVVKVAPSVAATVAATGNGRDDACWSLARTTCLPPQQ